MDAVTSEVDTVKLNCLLWDIREKSLLECLQQPLFMQYHDYMPFNENMLQPCPMLE